MIVDEAHSSQTGEAAKDLRVALAGLQLQPDTSVLGDPQPSRRARDQGARGESAATTATCAAAACEAGAFEQVVGELDVGAEAFDVRPLGAGERVVHGLR